MLIAIECPKCELKFGVEPENVKDNQARMSFHCCYCDRQFKRGDALKVIGVSGGVNIGGRVQVGGDVVGGNKYG